MPKTPKFLRKAREFFSRTPEPFRPPSRTHLSDITDDVRSTQSIGESLPSHRWMLLTDLIQGNTKSTSLVPSPADPAASPLGPTGVLVYSFVNTT